MATVPESRGDRIVLGAHAEGDVAAHVAGEDEETARRFGWWPERSTEETVRAAYADWARNWRDDGPVRAFAARDPHTGDLVGGCELRIGPDGTGQVAYWTHAGQRGRGHARNALELLAGYAASIGITRLEAHTTPPTSRSPRHSAANCWPATSSSRTPPGTARRSSSPADGKPRETGGPQISAAAAGPDVPGSAPSSASATSRPAGVGPPARR